VTFNCFFEFDAICHEFILAQVGVFFKVILPYDVSCVKIEMFGAQALTGKFAKCIDKICRLIYNCGVNRVIHHPHIRKGQ